jgi:hypothetical protein
LLPFHLVDPVVVPLLLQEPPLVVPLRRPRRRRRLRVRALLANVLNILLISCYREGGVR